MFTWFVGHLGLIVSIILGVYEVIARFIPTVADITILGNIIKFMKVISDFLNARK